MRIRVFSPRVLQVLSIDIILRTQSREFLKSWVLSVDVVLRILMECSLEYSEAPESGDVFYKHSKTQATIPLKGYCLAACVSFTMGVCTELTHSHTWRIFMMRPWNGFTKLRPTERLHCSHGRLSNMATVMMRRLLWGRPLWKREAEMEKEGKSSIGCT